AVGPRLVPVFPANKSCSGKHNGNRTSQDQRAVAIPKSLCLILAKLLAYLTKETVVGHCSPVLKKRRRGIFSPAPGLASVLTENRWHGRGFGKRRPFRWPLMLFCQKNQQNPGHATGILLSLMLKSGVS